MQDKPTLLIFSMKTCSPCKALKEAVTPYMEELKSICNFDGFKTLEEDTELAIQENIKSVPTIVIKKYGVDVRRLYGNIPYEQLKQAILDTEYVTEPM